MNVVYNYMLSHKIIHRFFFNCIHIWITDASQLKNENSNFFFIPATDFTEQWRIFSRSSKIFPKILARTEVKNMKSYNLKINYLRGKKM